MRQNTFESRAAIVAACEREATRKVDEGEVGADES